MKYKLTNNIKTVLGVRLYQIEALKCFGDIKSGQLGGWIQSEHNLSHAGNAWVSGNAQVSGDAQVSEDAWVSGNARVSENAQVSGNARVSGNAQVSGYAWVF